MKKIINIIPILCLLIFACDADTDYSSGEDPSTGTAGSLARFTIANNYLYTVDYTTLKVFDVSNEKNPQLVNSVYISFNIETIFAQPGRNLLFLGSSSGVYIFDISDPATPQNLALYQHTYSCDPVVVSGNYAYSTLNSSGSCNPVRGLDELDIIDVSDPEFPELINSIDLENPKGLGVKGNYLFVCDNGLKVFDISDKENPIYLKKYAIDAYDVIPIDTLLLVATESGLKEYSTASDTIVFISSLYTTN